MAAHPFNPMETLRSALRDHATRVRASELTGAPLETVDGWANGIGAMDIGSLGALLALAGLEIVRTDYLSAMTVIAKHGIHS